MSPTRLMKIIEKNKVLIVCLRPFRLYIYVRESWAIMRRINGVNIEVARDEVIQKDSWVIIINVRFIIIKRLIDGLSELNLNGSNEEKMSGIIQNMGGPIITLKVISFINLMF